MCSGSCVDRTSAILLNLRSPVRDARIEQWINQVEDEGGQTNGDDENEYDPLHNVEIAGENRLIEQGANARILEDNFDQHGARHELSQDECQRCHLRQEGIADRVVKEDGAALEPLS